MRNTINFGHRVFKHGLVLTTTILTCASLQAEHHEKDLTVKTEKHAKGQHGSITADQFIQKALKGGQMEVKMGQLAQQKGQSAEVKSLGETLVRDHTQANQKLQQLAQSKNIRVDAKVHDQAARDSVGINRTATEPQLGKNKVGAEDAHAHADHQAQHQQELARLQSQSGAEFDKAFVRMALKDHKKDIAEFEKCRTDVTDPEVKAFINEVLPKLRNHLQMAKNAARTVGVTDASLTGDANVEQNRAVGAPASGTRGSDKPSSPASNKDRLNQQSSLNPDLRDNSLEAKADIDADIDTKGDGISARADLDTDVDHNDGKIFQKGDGKVLGLSTDKNDGKFLGVIPNPNAKDDDDASIEAEVNVDEDESAVGNPASVETGRSKKID